MVVAMMDLDAIRAATPGLASGQVFLDSAGSSLPPTVVTDTVIGHLRREAEIGGYRAANERLDDLAAVKTSIARLIGATADTIALSDSATRSWADFAYSIPLRPGDRILISGADYASNAIAALQRAEQTGALVERIPSDATGRLDTDALAAMLDERVRWISLQHAPTNGGLVNPIAEATRIAHEAGALVLLDACQSIGQLPIDVAELGVDALSATGRKWLRGPRGTGFLYLREELARTMEPARLDLHSASWVSPTEYRLAPDASRFEFWECDVAARLGLGAAVDYLLTLGPEEVYAGVAARASHLRKTLPELAGVTVRDLGTEHSGIVSFTVDGHDPVELRDRLREHAVTVTVSHAGSTLLDMTERALPAIVRASPHYFVSTDDLDRFTAALARITG
ncbi:aminotransferase class V [Nocardia neocaledoniensis NBRC 108232]|uniref:Probable hercynylcysteine sulfoxide lyase n=2 Tax=Nocardia neocaledoniensis TaxID=236511 RepID=A0A317NAW0_9NOCA|nr:selenocysteine lyase/cysteine desulfurase [Nocardia neocaledoniensis]GEM32108.1 aminotransferase class V [Nocardia neocaledoniensis NBRC 108232]